MTVKLTKQGVRDLGGNRKPPKPRIPDQAYEVDIGIDGLGGVVLHIEASSLNDALRQGKQACRMSLYHEYSVLQVRRNKRIIWDFMNGRIG